MIPNNWFSLENFFLALVLVVMLGRVTYVVCARGWASVGWLSSTLGLFLAGYALLIWRLTEPVWDLPPNRGLIILAFAFWSSLLFCAAVIFPEKSDSNADLDAEFWQNKSAVLMIIGATNLVSILLHYAFLSSGGRISLLATIAMAISALCLFIAARAKIFKMVLVALSVSIAALGAASIL